MSERKQLGQAILDLTNGCDEATSMLAQIDALATSIGGIYCAHGLSMEDAQEFADEAATMIRQHIQAHWGKVVTIHHDRVMRGASLERQH